MLKEKPVYHFKAYLKHVNQDSTFEVRFAVMADYKFEARAMLDEWLKCPEQTGYKFECCVGVVEEMGSYVIVDDKTTDCIIDDLKKKRGKE
jgi:hypothetical protein